MDPMKLNRYVILCNNYGIVLHCNDNDMIVYNSKLTSEYNKTFGGYNPKQRSESE